MKLKVLEGAFAVCRLPSDSALPASFWSATRTANELSIVCFEKDVPEGSKTEAGWRIIEAEGPLDFGLTGILTSILTPLAAAKISIFALSTFDTDYVLVKEEKLEAAKAALSKAGFALR